LFKGERGQGKYESGEGGQRQMVKKGRGVGG